MSTEKIQEAQFKAAPRQPPGWWAQVRIILQKDLRMERQGGELTLTSGYFAVLVVVLSSMSFVGGGNIPRVLAAGVIWLSIAFAAVLSLGKGWAREREGGAFIGLLTTPLSPSALFVGKAAGLSLFLFAIHIVVVLLTALLFRIDILDFFLPLGVLSLCTLPGVAAAGTLFGAMTVKTNARDLVLATLLFPLLSPILLTAISASRELFGGAPLNEVWAYLKLILIFDVAFIAGGIALFGTLVED